MLSYMKGPKVDDWVLQQGDRLTIHVQENTLVNPMIPPTHCDDDDVEAKTGVFVGSKQHER